MMSNCLAIIYFIAGITFLTGIIMCCTVVLKDHYRTYKEICTPLYPVHSFVWNSKEYIVCSDANNDFIIKSSE